MDKPKTKVSELQNIQWEIARIVDEYWVMPEYDEDTVFWLREAFTNLNDAKLAIQDIWSAIPEPERGHWE